MVKPLRVLELGDVNPEDVKLPSAPVLLESVGRKDKEDECKSLEGGELLESVAILFFVRVKCSDLISDLVAVLICLVDIVGKGGVLWKEVDNEFEGVGLEGVL